MPRPAMRLAALMGAGVVYVMTHDSIGLGEDGPTHQPVEHLAALRAIPNMRVFRPCDAVEVAECWELALNRIDGPTVLALTRQNCRNCALQLRTTIPVAMAAMSWSQPKAKQKCHCSPPAPRSRSRSLPKSSSLSVASRHGWCRCPRWNCCWRSRRPATGHHRQRAGQDRDRGRGPLGWDAVIGKDGEFVACTASVPARPPRTFTSTSELLLRLRLTRP